MNSPTFLCWRYPLNMEDADAPADRSDSPLFCPGCAYPLKGRGGDRCPECGFQGSVEEICSLVRRLDRQVDRLLALITFGLPALVFAPLIVVAIVVETLPAMGALFFGVVGFAILQLVPSFLVARRLALRRRITDGEGGLQATYIAVNTLLYWASAMAIGIVLTVAVGMVIVLVYEGDPFDEMRFH